jgi:hypothetical protein
LGGSGLPVRNCTETFLRFDRFTVSGNRETLMDDTQDDPIRKRAHQIWEEEGRPHGKHDEHWRRAKSEVHGLEDLPRTGATRKAATKPVASTGQKIRGPKSAP